MNREFRQIPIEQLHRSVFQPRKTFDDASIEELAQSILAQGLIEPLVVRQSSINSYEIIAGERRWRAAMKAKLAEIPCLIGSYTDQQVAAISIVENIQREDLNVLEEAEGYKRLCSEFHFSQEDIAVLVGKSRSHIANLLRLCSLAPAVQAKLRDKTLNLGHARMLVGLDQSHQTYLAEKITRETWSVRQVEHYIKALKTKNRENKIATPKDQAIYDLEVRLSEHIGMPVEFICSPQEKGGSLKIKYFDNDTLAGLLERLGLRYD